jgi:hypothetical protein
MVLSKARVDRPIPTANNVIDDFSPSSVFALHAYASTDLIGGAWATYLMLLVQPLYVPSVRLRAPIRLRKKKG